MTSAVDSAVGLDSTWVALLVQNSNLGSQRTYSSRCRLSIRIFCRGFCGGGLGSSRHVGRWLGWRGLGSWSLGRRVGGNISSRERRTDS